MVAASGNEKQEKGINKKENFSFSELCCWTMEGREGTWINVKTRWIVRQRNFRVSTANLAWEKPKCKTPKPNDSHVHIYKINIVKSSLWSLELGPIKLDKKSIYYSHSNEDFRWNEWKHQGKLKTCQSHCSFTDPGPYGAF